MKKSTKTQRETVFIDGLSFKNPHANTPEFIKGNVSINVEKLTAFLNEHKNERGYVNVDQCKSKGGNVYFSLNDYQPETPSRI